MSKWKPIILPFEYPVIADIEGIKVHALPEGVYFVDWEGRSSRLSFSTGFMWSDPWLDAEYTEKVENAILYHKLKEIL